MRPECTGAEFGNLAEAGFIAGKDDVGADAEADDAKITVVIVKADQCVPPLDQQILVGANRKQAAIGAENGLAAVDKNTDAAVDDPGIGKAPAVLEDAEATAADISAQPDLPGVGNGDFAAGRVAGGPARHRQAAVIGLEPAVIAKVEAGNGIGAAVDHEIAAQIDAVARHGAGNIAGIPVDPVVPAHAVAPFIGDKAHVAGVSADASADAGCTNCARQGKFVSTHEAHSTPTTAATKRTLPPTVWIGCQICGNG